MLKHILITLVTLILISGCSSLPAINNQAGSETNTGYTGNNSDGQTIGRGLDWDPVIHRFSVTPANIPPGGKATLSWHVSNADAVSLNQDIGQVEMTGSMEVSPSIQTVYIITATNIRGSTYAKVTLTVNDYGPNKLPVIEEFKTNPEILKPDEPGRLIWKTSGATLVTINNVPVQLSGNKMIRQTESRTYMLIVTNSFGSDIRYLSVPVSN